MSNLSDFLELLKAPLRIISRNGKLMAITVPFYLIIYSISFILYMLSTNPVIRDLMLKIIDLASTRSGTPDFTKLLVTIRNDTGIFLGIEAAYVVLFFFIAIFSQTTVTLIAALYYCHYDLNLKELISQVSQYWTRAFVTSLWVQLIALGYTCFFLLPILVPSLVLFDHPTILITVLIFIAIIFTTLYLYLSVVWSLGVVVSVIENCSGFSALAKAREHMKGKRVVGFLLNLFFILVVIVILIMTSKLPPELPAIVVGVIQTLLLGVLGMFLAMAYTGFYFQCKKADGYVGIRYNGC